MIITEQYIKAMYLIKVIAEPRSRISKEGTLKGKYWRFSCSYALNPETEMYHEIICGKSKSLYPTAYLYSVPHGHTSLRYRGTLRHYFSFGNKPMSHIQEFLIKTLSIEVVDKKNTPIPPEPESIPTDIILKRMTEERNRAYRSLAGYKFQMFGYHAATWVNLNKLLERPRPNPFRHLVKMAKKEKIYVEGSKLQSSVEGIYYPL